ncbi:FAD binding domain-containing protein [Nocardia sp. X0981]
MKPAPFVYERAVSLEGAIASLAAHGNETKVLAGGQSLIPLMNQRLEKPTRLVDIMHVEGLDTLGVSEGYVEIGAAVRQRVVEQNTEIGPAVPMLIEALGFVAYPEVRNAGTVCGSLAHGDAFAEMPSVALALDAELVTMSSRGRRTIPATEFFLDATTTALAPDELLVAVRVPILGTASGTAFHEVAPRNGGYALAGVAARVDMADGVIVHAALSVLGAPPVPVRARTAETTLIGNAPGATLFAEAANVLARAIEARDDIHATATYRKQLVEVLARRALATAVHRIKEEL